MSNQATNQLPAYVRSAKPNPRENRAPWYKNTAPTYAGIFLWFVFWQDAVNTPNQGGALGAGLGAAILGLAVAALVCHFLFYLVPGLLGMKTGLPLYVVGTSVFGAQGGFLMPGFLMGVLQFGWLAVNAYFSSMLLAPALHIPAEVLMVVWAVLAAFVGLKGIQYVAKVATYIPLIPLLILLWMFIKTAGGLGSFDAQALIETHKSVVPSAPPPLTFPGVLAFALTYVVGFFATAGAAGVDFGLNSRDEKDVQMGGLVGVALAALVTAGLSALIVAGVYGTETLKQAALEAGKGGETKSFILQTTQLMSVIFGEGTSKWLWFLLALAAFPPACFSSFIAANSFKTTLPNVNPFVSVGIGTLVSIVLAVTHLAGDVVSVFQVIGASFGPICGAMMVDYLLAGKKWSGPRAGWNPAGWISWALGFIVGILPLIKIYDLPAAPVAAFIVGAAVYWVCMKAGMSTQVVPLQGAEEKAA
ncbi:MAG: cytosine permease [Verrucomicrobia bacterium]|nr:cytosine permease [Verrucomicrobiota bacterium]